MGLPDTAETDPAIHLERILEEFARHYPGVSTATLERAYEAASRAHEGQVRQTGHPYITHPLIVTEILASYGMDEATLIAAILHDTVEDTDISLQDTVDEFGEEVAELIDGVTKLDRIRFSSREEHQAATIRKMAIAMAKDIRVLLIKLADRLHNIRTLAPLPPEKRERIAIETIEVYAPLAHRLGVQEIKHEMEEHCFRELYPKRMAELEDLIKRRAPQREADVEKVMTHVRDELTAQGIEATVTGRPKHLYSIYRKMMASGLEFEQIYDLIGVRVLVNEVRDCYAALGLVHTLWAPIQGRFKDYIAMPKFNLYQSLHTTVVGPDGKALEVQIRTHEMHRRAEHGIAAHWRYKEGDQSTDPRLIADLRFLQEESTNPEEFLEHLKLDLYADEVFALTPKGDVHVLPRGGTPVDFAYRIHTDVGHRCVGAKVNGKLAPLSSELQSGDIVEIITTKAADARPSRDWLEFVKSSRAQSKIRQWYTRARRETALSDGRDAIVRALRRSRLPVDAFKRDEALLPVAQECGFHDVDALYVSVGDGRHSPLTIITRLEKLHGLGQEEEDLLSPPIRPRERRPTSGITVEGMDDMLVRIARCCAAVPGDEIIGFVTVGRGVSVHRADCANIGALGERAERIIDVSWDVDYAGSFFSWIQIEALDRPKLLRDVTEIISDHGGNIQAASSATGRDRVAILRFEVQLSDPQQLERIIAETQRIDGVFDAYRLVPQGPAR
ncbi:MAG: bifunctional (p)ppGpp synthetase/guanosine-3',5'-bis(diphosphate) 3'-pyrophosphohydrolase [Actinomycetota bacterium]|nr:bifunctional (p)ppGpp synthetase/guanosine-3',5'-bis(diphosphate) 3'-pyrophosphohydrolase [Actinomycetota bacterium]